jgi:transcriptional regulator with XRE-family HTH domain
MDGLMHMNTTASQRLKGLRELTGLKRKEFADILGIDDSHLKSIELGRAELNENDFAKVCRHFPSFTAWLTYEGEIDLAALKQKQEALMRFMAMRIESGHVPEGYFLEKAVRHEQ